MSLIVRNPHSVLAALQTRPKDVLEVRVRPGIRSAAGDAWNKAVSIARENRVPVREIKGGPRNESSPDGRESLAEAQIRERVGLTAEELFEGARERANGKGLWLALDSLQDPHNVGAIFRAAAFFGVQGIVLTEERSAPLSSTVYDVSCGGVEHVPFALQTNLQRAFETAKESGLWILGASEHASDDLSTIALDRPWLLVLGNEEKGMRRLTEESCDVLCRISAKGKGVTSLNVSVAAGILISRLSG